MKQNSPNHLSVSLDIDTSSLPITFFDRIPTIKMIKGVVLSMIIMLIAPMVRYFYDSENNIITDDIYNEPQSEAFFYILPLIGFLFLIANLATFFQKRKIVIDEKNVTVYNRTLTGTQDVFVEPISNYIGVRYRGRIFKYGFFVKVQQVIELLNEDSSKTIPIYIGSNTKGIRQRWQKIAKDFNMPTVTRTADGYKILNYNDLLKPIAALVQEGKIKNDFDSNLKKPNIFALEENSNKKTLIINKMTRESGAFLVASIVMMFSFLLFLFLLRIDFNFPNALLAKKVLLALNVIIIFVVPVIMILRRQGIILEQDKIQTIFKLPFVSLKTARFDKDEINAVDVVYREIENAYFVAITSKDKTVHLGKGCDAVSLKWLNNFIIKNIINP